MKPNDKTTQWNSEPAVNRLHKCKTMLVLHGFLTDAESKRVHARLMKWIGKHVKKA